MKKININGLTVFDTDNEKQPIILVHAFPLTSKMWNRQIEFFQNKYRVIPYDVRGLGESHDEHCQFTMEEYAEDLLTIINQLGLTGVIAMGVSMGGYIIQRAYIKSPELFNVLILSDTKGERDTDTGLISRAESIKLLKNKGKELFAKSMAEKLIAPENHSNLKNHIIDMINGNSVESIIGSQIAIATRTNTIDYFNSVSIPVLIICGENDILTPLPEAEKLYKAIANSELVIIKNCGHLPNIENPTLFNKKVLDFLTANEKT